jgi:hypothetical protein
MTETLINRAAQPGIAAACKPLNFVVNRQQSRRHGNEGSMT